MKILPSTPRIFYSVITLAGLALFTIIPSAQSFAQKSRTPRDNQRLEQAANEIEKALLEVERAMNELKSHNLPKLEADLKKTMQELLDNKELIAREMAEAMSQVEIELKNMKGHINTAELQREIQDGMKTAQSELQRAQEELQNSLGNIKSNISGELRRAGLDLQQAKKDIEMMKQGITELKADGLLPAGNNDDLQIEFRDELMYINGKVQSKEVSEKYRKYFKSNSLHFGSKGRKVVI